MIEHVWLERGIVRWHIGEVNAHHYIESGARLRQDERFSSMNYIIDDFIDCTSLPEAEVVMTSQQSHADWGSGNSDFRHAIVSSSASLRERAYRMALKGMGSPAIMKFSCMNKARDWVRSELPQSTGSVCQMAGIASTLSRGSARVA